MENLYKQDLLPYVHLEHPRRMVSRRVPGYGYMGCRGCLPGRCPEEMLYKQDLAPIGDVYIRCTRCILCILWICTAPCMLCNLQKGLK